MAIPNIQDENTRSLLTIDYVHHEIHEGSHFYMQNYTTLGIDGTLYVKILTPDTGADCHFRWSIASSGICESWLDEAATGGMANGSNVVPINNNRNSSKSSAMIITSGVTINTGYGLRIENDKWGAAGFKTTIGGGSSRDDELLLKRNTVYLRAFKSKAADNIIQFEAAWYEHTSKE